MKDVVSNLSNLKLRVSWGKTGNNSVGNYDWQANYTTASAVVEGTDITGLKRSKISNDNLHWETTENFDLGLDFGFFNNRLNGVIDYYYKKTTDILFHPSLYLTMGYVGTSSQNLGRVDNSAYRSRIELE